MTTNLIKTEQLFIRPENFYVWRAVADHIVGLQSTSTVCVWSRDAHSTMLCCRCA